jgi:Domain of unknown function (DUF4172)
VTNDQKILSGIDIKSFPKVYFVVFLGDPKAAGGSEAGRSSEIEGEVLDRDQVRSSIARSLGLDIGALAPADRDVEGVVETKEDRQPTARWLRGQTHIVQMGEAWQVLARHSRPRYLRDC